MRKRHHLNPYPTWAQVKKHDSSGWADTEEQEQHHNCSWFNRSSIGGFHKSKTSFWTDKDILLNCYNGGLSPPRPRIVVPIVAPEQWHIWKIPAALEHFASVYGTVGVFHPSNYTFLYNSTGYIQSCVHLPYLSIVGHFDIDLSTKIVNCTACALYTCLNHTISYHNASIALVKQRSEL